LPLDPHHPAPAPLHTGPSRCWTARSRTQRCAVPPHRARPRAPAAASRRGCCLGAAAAAAASLRHPPSPLHLHPAAPAVHGSAAAAPARAPAVGAGTCGRIRSHAAAAPAARARLHRGSQRRRERPGALVARLCRGGEQLRQRPLPAGPGPQRRGTAEPRPHAVGGAARRRRRARAAGAPHRRRRVPQAHAAGVRC
jgi:hypothetical protein